MLKRERQALIIDRQIDRKIEVGSLQIEMKSSWSIKVGYLKDAGGNSSADSQVKKLESTAEEIVEILQTEVDQLKVKISQ